MNRGEIWRAKVDKTRPAVILTRDELIPFLNTVTIAPITRTIRDVPSEVLIGMEEGLKEASIINLHHVMTLPKTHLTQFIGSVSQEKMKKIFHALTFSLGFEKEL